MRNCILPFLMIFLFLGCSASSKDKILFVTSNQRTYGNTDLKTANHFAEIVLAYDVFIKSGYQVDFVSPEGGEIPIGYINTSDPIQKKYLDDKDFMNLFKNTYSPEAIDAKNYKAVYYSGGGAAMFGVPENKAIQGISREIYENTGIVSTICHGTAGIVNLKLTNGKYLYEEKEVNGFADAFENKNKAYYKTFPFSIEEAITKNGGNFTYSKKGWDNHYIVDGRLITGQDPTASVSVAKQVVAMLQKTNHK
ncbi:MULTISPECIES: type 1 glutamine amidotransferase domain-containing protein [Aquimarina]|uniref:type 1 glutamine amidotransferase domain-containing protein n=1 Tax=Aquimarina TaxID=290174 RepID=UPI000942DAB9|nr:MULTISPECIES: type 1 glutamine amidotransferase domain-containing protein [Aquimarina]